ncbi:MAG: hypothetical protein LBH73_03300 [Spirochaetaceae bacterium]|jgi:hypothetical protein|nr:hypothetical protein [Spirochaetaceae bacterium]
MKGRLKSVFAVLCFFLSVVVLSGQNVAPFTMPNARSAALGGDHAALADDFYGLFTNPASFVGVKEEFSASELSLSTYGPILEILDIVTDPGSDIDITSLVGPGGFAAGFELGGPLSFGWVGRGFGFSLSNRTKADARISGLRIMPLVSEDFLLTGGYSYRFIDNNGKLLDAGFLTKGFFRGTLKLTADYNHVEDIIDDPLGAPFVSTLGVGLDLGVKFMLHDIFGAALVCHDVYSPALVNTYASMEDFVDGNPSISGNQYETVKRRLDFGLFYRLRSEVLERYITHLIFLADYRDALSFLDILPRNPILNIGLGMELRILEVLDIRFGITDALPCFGFGIDMTFMQLNLAIHGRELGLDPGVQSVYALEAGITFRY